MNQARAVNPLVVTTIVVGVKGYLKNHIRFPTEPAKAMCLCSNDGYMSSEVTVTIPIIYTCHLEFWKQCLPDDLFWIASFPVHSTDLGGNAG